MEKTKKIKQMKDGMKDKYKKHSSGAGDPIKADIVGKYDQRATLNGWGTQKLK